MNGLQKARQIFKAAIAVNNRPFPWERAIGAALAMSLPIFMGLWFNQLQYGLMAGLGGFTYLYAFRLPYAHLAKRLLFVGLMIVLCAFLGSIVAPYPIAMIILIGLIATVMIFIFNALKFIGPSAIFFIMVFALTADMPITDLQGAFFRAGLVALGALLSWLIAMSGFLINPHRPEIKAVSNAYHQLHRFTASLGTDQFHDEKYKTMSLLRDTLEILMSGELPGSPSKTYQRLLHLTIVGNEYFLYLMSHYAEQKEKLPNECLALIEQIECVLKNNLKKSSLFTIPQLSDIALQNYYQTMANIINDPAENLKPISLEKRITIKEILLNTIDRNSLVFLTSIRFGIITSIATIIAHSFDFTRSYWIPLSCVAVMSGASMVATFHRALQRSMGTMLGIIIATAILHFHPSGYAVALSILLFTALTELFIVKNYGLAIIFITPNALILAETITGGEFSAFYFASARMIDVIIGSIIGLTGVILMGRRTASLRIPRIMMRTLRNQSQMLLLLFSQKTPSSHKQISDRIIKMRTNVTNLTALYDAASGEIPLKKALIEYYWPIIYSIEKIAFLLEHAAEMDHRNILTESEIASLIYLFEVLANSLQYNDPITIRPVPIISQFPTITQEIIALQNAIEKTLSIPK